MAGPILVVDDDRSSREAMTLALKYYGFDVVPAASGAEGLAYLRAGGPAEMILLELMMPDMNGWTFRRAMQLDPWLADIPVVVVSAVKGTLRGLAAVAAFQKPIDVNALIRTVRIISAQRSAVDE